MTNHQALFIGTSIMTAATILSGAWPAFLPIAAMTFAVYVAMVRSK